MLSVILLHASYGLARVPADSKNGQENAMAAVALAARRGRLHLGPGPCSRQCVRDGGGWTVRSSRGAISRVRKETLARARNSCRNSKLCLISTCMAIDLECVRLYWYSSTEVHSIDTRAPRIPGYWSTGAARYWRIRGIIHEATLKVV